MSQTSPVPPGRVRGSRPAAISRWAISCGGAVLGPAELRYRVERSAPAHDVGAVGGEPGVEPGRAAARTEVGHGEVGDGQVGVRLQQGHRAPPAPTPGRPATARCVSGPRIEAALTCIFQWCSPGRRCTNRNRASSRIRRRGVADLRRTGLQTVTNGRGHVTRTGCRAVRRVCAKAADGRFPTEVSLAGPSMNEVLPALIAADALEPPMPPGAVIAGGGSAACIRAGQNGCVATGWHGRRRGAPDRWPVPAVRAARQRVRWAPCGRASTRCCSAGSRSRS